MTPTMKKAGGKKGKKKSTVKPAQDIAKSDNETSHKKDNKIDEEVFFDVNESTPQASETEKETTVQPTSAIVQPQIINEISDLQETDKTTSPQITTEEATVPQVTSGIAELDLSTTLTHEKEQEKQQEQEQEEEEEEAEFDDFVEAASIPLARSLEKKSRNEILDIMKSNIKVPMTDKSLIDLSTLLTKHKRQTEELLYIREEDKIKTSNFNDSVLRKRLKELWSLKNK